MTRIEGATFYRYMSRAEAEAVERTGFLKGGRPGRTYWTDEYFERAEEAQGRLALKLRPQVRLAFRITNDPKLVLEGTRVRPKDEQAGGGTEWMTIERVEVEVIGVDNLE